MLVYRVEESVSWGRKLYNIPEGETNSHDYTDITHCSQLKRVNVENISEYSVSRQEAMKTINKLQNK